MTDTLIADLLSEGLDLCVRARKLDEQVERALEAGMGRIFADEMRCGTPALWVQEQYDNDLADWERRARAALTQVVTEQFRAALHHEEDQYGG